MSRHLFRVQAADGRGPYRPGLSDIWSDKDGPALRPWWIELGKSVRDAMAMVPHGMHSGSAFESITALTEWFSASERTALHGLGFYVVRFKPHQVIARTPTQVVFSQHFHLSGLPMFGALVDVKAA